MIYLASKSPRRRQLLQQIGIHFELIEGEVDESIRTGESGIDYCYRVAREKATAGWHNPDRVNDWPVLGADTTVIVDEVILTKPESEQHAMEMLSMLQGKTHQVITAVALQTAVGLKQTLSQTEVTFAPMSLDEIKAYIASGEAMGRAGSYAIQGCIAQYIKHLSGSYSGVVGLPLYETAQLLR